jgi:hypothetical protein
VEFSFRPRFLRVLLPELAAIFQPIPYGTDTQGAAMVQTVWMRVEIEENGDG